MLERRQRRSNGFSPPYTIPQIGVWIALFGSFAEFAVFVSPIMQIIISILVTLIFFVFGYLVLYYGIRTLLIDPIDLHFYHRICDRRRHNNSTSITTNGYTRTNDNANDNNNGHVVEENVQQTTITEDGNHGRKKSIKKDNNIPCWFKLFCCWNYYCSSGTMSSSSSNEESYNPVGGDNNDNDNTNIINDDYQYRLNPYLLTRPTNDEMKQCWICDTQVAKHSMHCKFCNKCVYHFDHHCLWLNTCIGHSNYKPFYRTMVSLFIMELIHFITQVVLILDIFIEFGPTKQLANNWIGYKPIVAVLIYFVLFNSVSMGLLGQLILFHMNLQTKKITTYEYIVIDSRRRRELSQLKADLESLRVREIALAQNNHDIIRTIQLSCGGFCRNELHCPYFDPLQFPSSTHEMDQQRRNDDDINNDVSNDNDDEEANDDNININANHSNL